MIKIHRYVFDLLDSNMYVLIEGNDAIIIDPHYSNEAEKLLLHHSVKNLDIILTHEHFDHVSGAVYYAKHANNIIANCYCKDKLGDPNNRINSRFAATFVGANQIIRQRINEVCKEKVVVLVNKCFKEEFLYVWGNHKLYFRTTPGHTLGSICMILDDKYLFTGDSLIPGNEIVTRFPGGSEKDYKLITRKFLEQLDKDLIVCPGHGEMQKLGEII